MTQLIILCPRGKLHIASAQVERNHNVPGACYIIVVRSVHVPLRINAVH